MFCVGYVANEVANGLLALCHSSGRCYMACSVSASLAVPTSPALTVTSVMSAQEA